MRGTYPLDSSKIKWSNDMSDEEKKLYQMEVEKSQALSREKNNLPPHEYMDISSNIDEEKKKMLKNRK